MNSKRSLQTLKQSLLQQSYIKLLQFCDVWGWVSVSVSPGRFQTRDITHSCPLSKALYSKLLEEKIQITFTLYFYDTLKILPGSRQFQRTPSLSPFMAPTFLRFSCQFCAAKSANQCVPQHTSHLLVLFCAPPGFSSDGYSPLPELLPIYLVELFLAGPALRRADHQQRKRDVYWEALRRREVR